MSHTATAPSRSVVVLTANRGKNGTFFHSRTEFGTVISTGALKGERGEQSIFVRAGKPGGPDAPIAIRNIYYINCRDDAEEAERRGKVVRSAKR
jgi:hypothetical protein